MGRPRILLADDHTILLDAFRALLTPEFDVVASVTDGRALLVECSRSKPDVVVLDIAMPLLNGLDAGRRLKAEGSPAKLIYLTVNADPSVAREALRLGASAYLLKSSAATELRTAIQEALRGRSYVTPLILHDVVASAERHDHDPVLTPRERQVLQLLAEGRSMKEAAAILEIAPRTVAFHKYRIMERFDLRSSAELIRFAIEHDCLSS